MPEIAEIARIVHFLRLHLVGKTVKTVEALDDTIIFGKAGTTGKDVEVALTGQKVVSAGSQGKYFWIALDKPPHLVMHFGMTGWIHIKGEQTQYTNYYKKMKPGDADVWPPKFWKFHLTTHEPKVEIAFTDPRRLGRVRLVHCPGDSIRDYSPLVENGPDPVVDTDRFTLTYLKQKMQSRHVPIKALLLDQKVISGIGNWVGDEVLYQAKLHPEQYCDDFDQKQIKVLYEAIRHVCKTAVDKLGDSDQFPEDWMFNYRWSKGSKEPSSLPNGQRLAFLTVGGRTSCYAPGLQKKSGRVAADVKEEPLESDEEEAKPITPKKKSTTPKSKGQNNKRKKEETDEDEDETEEKPRKKSKTASKSGVDTNGADTPEQATTDTVVQDGRRRSGRVRKLI